MLRQTSSGRCYYRLILPSLRRCKFCCPFDKQARNIHHIDNHGAVTTTLLRMGEFQHWTSSRGSSVKLVTDYGPEDRGIWDRFKIGVDIIPFSTETDTLVYLCLISKVSSSQGFRLDTSTFCDWSFLVWCEFCNVWPVLGCFLGRCIICFAIFSHPITGNRFKP